MRVGVGEEPAEEHLVGAGPDPGHEVRRFERGELDVGVVVGRVAVEDHRADRDRRVVGMRPHLGEIERVEPIPGRVVERHDLHLERPARVLAAGDRVVEVAKVMVGVYRGHLVTLVLGEELDALIGLEVVLHPEPLTGPVHPHERV